MLTFKTFGEFAQWLRRAAETEKGYAAVSSKIATREFHVAQQKCYEHLAAMIEEGGIVYEGSPLGSRLAAQLLRYVLDKKNVAPLLNALLILAENELSVGERKIIEAMLPPKMDERFKDIPLGLYRIYWIDTQGGGYSLASVGQTYDGTRWFAPCNWSCSEGKPFEASTDWSHVERVELVEAKDITPKGASYEIG